MTTTTHRRSRRNTRQFQIVRYWTRKEEECDVHGDWSSTSGSGPFATREAAEKALQEARHEGYAGAFVTKEICLFDIPTNPVTRSVVLQLCHWRERQELEERHDSGERLVTSSGERRSR